MQGTSPRYGRGERTYFLLAGIVIGVPVSLFFESVSFMWFSTIGIATIVAPLVEEFAKANPLFYRSRPARTMIVLGFIAGLGFGLAEALVYIYSGVPFFIRLPAIFFHAAGTMMVGYGVATRRTVQYYFLAVALHFLHNLVATTGIVIGAFAVTLLSYLIAWRLYVRAQHHESQEL